MRQPEIEGILSAIGDLPGADSTEVLKRPGQRVVLNGPRAALKRIGLPKEQLGWKPYAIILNQLAIQRGGKTIRTSGIGKMRFGQIGVEWGASYDYIL